MVWYGDGETTGRKEVAAAMQWHGIMGALLQASSSKLGRPPYGSADCVIWRANADLHAGTIAAAAVDDKALGTLACCGGSVSWLTFGYWWMLGLAGVSMQWRVLRKTQGDDEECLQWESGIAIINAARWCCGRNSK